MTYPDNATGLKSLGFFTEKGKSADKQRDRLVAIGNQWFEQCKSDRLKVERQWYLNLAFYGGNQHVQFRSTQGGGAFDLYVPKAPYYRVRIVVNQVRRIIRKEIARLTAQKPNAYVVPSTSEDADVFAAQAGEQIWDSLWRRLKFNKTLREAVFWQSVCGTGYIKSYWDANKVDMDSTNIDGNPIAGDICIESVTPFHILVPDLMCTEIENQPYLIHAQVKPNSWVRNKFKLETTDTKFSSVDEELQTVLGINKQEKKETTTILEVWVKPDYLPEMPQGGMFLLAGDKLIQGWDRWPYDHGQYPFSKLDSIPTGKFYTASVLEDLIPLQKELNRTRGQLIEAKNRMAKPQLTAEKGTVDAQKITTEPGQVIFYSVGAQPPQPIPLQNLPNYVTQEIDRLYTDLSDLSGQHEVSNGSTPPGVTAATAISFLQEQDESLISTHFTSIEEAIEKVASQSLYYVDMYWDEARTIKIVGVEGSFDVQTFKNADIRGNKDIRVEAGSSLPTSRAARQAFIMDLMKMGFVNPEEGLELMEVGGLTKIYERIQVDKRQAQRENLKMAAVTEEQVQMHQLNWAMTTNPEAQKDVDAGLKLVPPPIVTVNTWDNHEVHIEMHNMYRKSQQFERANSTTRALFEEHVRQHQEALSGMLTHPLTGMDPSDPNAPDPADEEAAMDQMEQDGGTNGGTTGPEPMPEMSDEPAPEQVMQ